MIKSYAQIGAKIVSEPWLITPEGLSMILSIYDARVRGERLTDEEIAIRLEQAGTHGAAESTAEVSNGIGVLPIYGPIFGKANLMTQLSGATSMEQFRKDLKAMLADDSIHSIIMDIDSPGGSSEMIPEAGEEIRAGRDIKPIYAVANNMAGSAAFWLASQASRFYSTPSGNVGSVGVYTVHEDQSGRDKQEGVKYTYISAAPYKTEGNPHEPLSKEGRDYRQERVNELYDEFLEAIALGRGITADKVKSDFGGGRMLTSKHALTAGMIDDIREFDAIVEDLAVQARTPTTVMVSLGGKSYNATWTGNSYEMSVADYEHSEPGTGTPPEPRKPESKDKAIEGGWRRLDLPEGFPNEDQEPGAPKANSTEGGTGMDEERLKQLMQLFSVDSEDALMSAITEMHGEASALRADVALATEEQRLATESPQLWERIKADREKLAKQDAESFVSSVATIKRMDGDKLVDTNFVLSTLAKDTVEETYLKFASGTAGLEDFTNCVKAITESGTVEMGERGSNLEGETPTFDLSTATGVQAVRQQFAAKVAEIQAKDSLDLKSAMAEAATRYPDLAKAYRATTPA